MEWYRHRPRHITRTELTEIGAVVAQIVLSNTHLAQRLEDRAALKLLQKEVEEECPSKHPLRDILVSNYAQLASNYAQLAVYHRTPVQASVVNQKERRRGEILTVARLS